MIPPLHRLGQKLLFALEPERAHGLSIRALASGLPLGRGRSVSQRLRVNVAGLDFPNPLGMAAGFDKNAQVPDALLRLGFGFAEVGTVTPKPQAGNPRPRIFRLQGDHAVINRLGFNNEGHEAAFQRLTARSGKTGIVGINIGANKDSADRIGDYEGGVARFARLASYLTINISSPNTPGLRQLQGGDNLSELLDRVLRARENALANSDKRTPIFLKIAPDLVEAEMEQVAKDVRASGIEGLIVSNTTLSRTGLTDLQANEAGGLSGAPLFERSTIMLARMRRLLGEEIAIIGVGGVETAEHALEKIRAGADLVQLYTAMIYAGPSLPGRIVERLDRLVAQAGAASVPELRGTSSAAWADRDMPA